MMKKTFLIFLLSLLFASLSFASDQDFLHGKVLEVDPEGLVMIVQPDQDAGEPITVLLSSALMVESGSGELRLPGCVNFGNHIRVWGKAGDGLGATFQAFKVRGCGMASCNDPTGVRARLSRKRQGAKKEVRCQ